MDTKTKLLKLKVEQQDVAILQRKDMFSVSLDTILLINFIKIKNQDKILIDFGTNNGAIAVLLAKKYPVNIIGIEIQKEAVDLAKHNVKLNNLANRVTIIHDDIKNYSENNAKGKKVDMIVCNPPFFPLSTNTNLKQEPLKRAARHEIYINLANIISSAANLLKVRGKLFIIYNIERLDELIICLKQYQFSIKRMQIVYPKIDKNANVVLLEAVFKTNAGMIMEAPLICHNQDNSYNSEIAKWYNKNNNN